MVVWFGINIEVYLIGLLSFKEIGDKDIVGFLVICYIKRRVGDLYKNFEEDINYSIELR